MGCGDSRTFRPDKGDGLAYHDLDLGQLALEGLAVERHVVPLELPQDLGTKTTHGRG